MGKSSGNNHTTAKLGRESLKEELQRRGFSDIREFVDNRRRVIAAKTPAGMQVHLMTRTRRAGTWQSSITERDKVPPATPCYWIFVDLAVKGDQPEYYVVPDAWIREDIGREHDKYLMRSGGSRRYSPEATHHAIDEGRIKQWRGKWNQLA